VAEGHGHPLVHPKDANKDDLSHAQTQETTEFKAQIHKVWQAL
jgi:hypothetical protein